mmetsp:Transcript_12007/g.27818  ORF Transcript_12007/g.27818 Transcript_12007/m.27818 type:complete len:204 (-) Transcript_12007:246-857(-)
MARTTYRKRPMRGLGALSRRKWATEQAAQLTHGSHSIQSDSDDRAKCRTESLISHTRHRVISTVMIALSSPTMNCLYAALRCRWIARYAASSSPVSSCTWPFSVIEYLARPQSSSCTLCASSPMWEEKSWISSATFWLSLSIRYFFVFRCVDSTMTSAPGEARDCVYEKRISERCGVSAALVARKQRHERLSVSATGSGNGGT